MHEDFDKELFNDRMDERLFLGLSHDTTDLERNCEYYEMVRFAIKGAIETGSFCETTGRDLFQFVAHLDPYKFDLAEKEYLTNTHDFFRL